MCIITFSDNEMWIINPGKNVRNKKERTFVSININKLLLYVLHFQNNIQTNSAVKEWTVLRS